MSSILRTAWRVVVRRARSDKAVLAAVFATTVLAVGLLAAGPIYADATSTSSLRRTLADTDVADSSVVVETRVEPNTFDADDLLVETTIENTFTSTGADIFRRATSDSFGVSGIETASESDLVVFRTYTGFDARTELIDGSWPETGSDPVEVAILDATADDLGLEIGSRFQVTSRLDANDSHHVRVSGVYHVTDATDPYWIGDPLDLTGALESASFMTHGPLVVTPNTYFETVGRQSSKIRWAAFPHHDLVQVTDIRDIVTRLEGMEDRLNAGRELGNQMQVETALNLVLRDSEEALLVTRSAVLTVSIQLAVLAAYALLLAAGLLVDTRELESATLKARGAGAGQLVSMAAMEGLLISMPAFVLGPPLAVWAIGAFNVTGPLAEIGLSVEPTLSTTAWALGGAAAAGCIAALVIPSYLATRRSGSVRARRAREARGVVRETGLDVALLVIAGVGIWQLDRYGASLTTTVRGRTGIDPLLVAAPALALMAGGVLALRVLPLLARWAEHLSFRRRGLPTSLGIWHLSRQPRRYSRSALMLMLALAIGVFALSYDATWRQSQRDQASFQVGGDVLVEPSTVAGRSVPPQYLVDAHARLDSFVDSMPMVRATGEVFGASKPIRFAGLNSETAAELLDFRPDQSVDDFSELMSRLAAGHPPLPGIQLAGRPTHLAIAVSMEIEPPELPPDVDISTIPTSLYGFEPSIRAVLADRDGLTFRVDFGEVVAGGNTVQMRALVGRNDGVGGLFRPQYPISLVGYEIRGLAPFSGLAQESLLKIDALSVSDSGTTWTEVTPPPLAHTAEASTIRLAGEEPGITVISDEPLIVRLETGTTVAQTRQEVYHSVWMGEPPAVETIPVLASSDAMTEIGVGLGDPIPLDGLPDFRGAGVIVGEVKTFPTIDPEENHAIVFDTATLHAAVLGPGSFPPTPDRYIVDVGEGKDRIFADQLRNEPYNSEFALSRSAALDDLVLDPVALGTIGALLAGLVAAAALAAIGFLVNVVVSSRDRSGQFALMKAVGLKTNQVTRWAGVENSATVAFSAIFGTLLGLGLAGLILPLSAITQEATAVRPGLIVVIPWAPVGGLVLFVLILLGIATALVGRLVTGLDLANLMRAGDE